MKKNFRFLAIILVTLLLISSLPLAAFAYETEDAENVIDEILDTEYSDTIASADIETEDSSETEISETEETETITFEFSEEDCLMNNARVIGDGEVGFDPPEEDTEAVQITSLEVPEGVYSLQNLGSALWMNIEQNKIYAGYHVQQTSSSENPANAFTRASLFKISEKSDGQYIIRLMTNNKLSFAFDGNTVKTKEISPIDSEVADADTFTITCISGNYVIRPYGVSYAVSANNSSDANLTKRISEQAGDYAKWKLYRYKGDYRAGTTIVYTASYKNKGIPVGTSGTIYNITWSTEIGTNYPYMAVADGYETMMDSEWLDTIQKLSFEAISPGNVKIYSMICRSNTTAYQYRGYATFQVIPREGTYVIRNEGTDKYVDINGSSTSEGALINQSSFSTEDSQKWIIEHVSNGQGYVRIKSAYSNKYIGVDSTTNTTIKQTSTLDNYSLWKFERTTAGNLKLVCKALATTKVLAIPTGSSMNNNGTNLTTVTYTTNSDYNDEWELNEIEYSFTLHHYYDNGYDERFSDTDKTASEKIQSYHNAVAERLLQIFGVIVYSECETEPFESSADHCKWLKHNDDYLDYINIVEDCTHGSGSEPNIHLTRTAINSVNFPKSDILTPVIWTGYIMPSEDYRTSVTFNKMSIVMTPYNMTTLDEDTSEYINKSSDNVKKLSIYELLHEVCHTLGAYDHYCYYHYNSYNPSNTPCTNEHCDICVNHMTNRACVMLKNPSEVIDQTSDEDLLCQDCIQIIREHLAEHHESS